MDTNKDGVVSREEFIAFHTAMYDKTAAEHGGSLKVPPPPQKHDIKIIVDGKEIKPGEMPEGMHMKIMDEMGEHGMGDHGGENVMIMRRGPGGPEGEGHGPMGEHMKMMGPHGFDEMDKNHDGKVSFDEFSSPMREAFDHLDANHDGALSKDELAKGHMNVRIERREHSEEKHEEKH